MAAGIGFQERELGKRPHAGVNRESGARFRWRGWLSEFVNERGGSVPAESNNRETQNRKLRKMEAALERLHDLLWEAREREARYRDLLDRQCDVILRRDGAGRLTFVNDAFCRIFGIKRAEAVGRSFEPVVLERIGERPLERGRLRSELKIETASGSRWFVWQEFRIRDGSDADGALQIVGRDITRERETASALETAREAAETANRAKSRFLAAMSHEIRTPMNGVLGMTRLLLETSLTPEQKTYAQAIATSSQALLSLIDEVMDFSRVEAGRIILDLGPFSLAALIEGVVELLAPRARSKGLDIAWVIDPALPDRFIGDQLRLRQVLNNLIGNAIKFTHSGGVTVRASGNAQDEAGRVRLWLSVSDTGPGIEAAAQARIFDEFEQEAGTLAQPHDGIGFGLAISKRITEAMGGEVLVESGPGAGATFTIALTLPRAQQSRSVGEGWIARGARRALIATSEIEAVALAEQLRFSGWHAATCGPSEFESVMRSIGMQFDAVLADLTAAAHVDSLRRTRGVLIIDPGERGELSAYRRRGFSDFLVRPVRPQSLMARLAADTGHLPVSVEMNADERRSPGATACKILLAEDNEINALVAVSVLIRGGHEVVAVRDGAAAVEAVRAAIVSRQPFDIALIDVHMPVMNGIEAARRIRALFPDEAHPGNGRPALIAVTANILPEDSEACLRAGLDGYLVKPFEPEDLGALIGRWTRAAELHPESREGAVTSASKTGANQPN